jgi:hypothetical protein
MDSSEIMAIRFASNYIRSSLLQWISTKKYTAVAIYLYYYMLSQTIKQVERLVIHYVHIPVKASHTDKNLKYKGRGKVEFTGHM